MSTSEVDRLTAVRCLRRSTAGMGAVPVVGLIDCHLGEAALLRLVEAGMTHLSTLRRLGCEPEFLEEFLEDPDSALSMPTKRQLRLSMGFREEGDIERFDEAISDVPASTWSPGVKQNRLPISRRKVRSVRELCRDLAGLPPPESSRYSTSFRNAPDAPEWSVVRDFVRSYRGLDLEDAASQWLLT